MKNMTLAEAFRIILKRLPIIIALTVLLVLISGVYNIFIQPPEYTASANILFASGELFKGDETESTAQQSSGYITTGELSTTLALMKSFSAILENSTDYFESVLSDAEADGLIGEYSVRALQGCTAVVYDPDAIYIEISVTTPYKEDSETLIYHLATNAPDCITDKLARTSAVPLNIDTVARDTSPGLAMTCILVALVSFVILTAVMIVIGSFDRSIKDEEDFKRHFDLPVLGVVPEFSNKRKSRSR